MELSLDTQWIIIQIATDLNTYFRKRLIDAYLEIAHLDRSTTIHEC